MNVGASEESDYGLYFQWGDIDGVQDGDTFNFTSEQYAETAGGALDDNIVQGGANDAAHAILGGPWKIPTKAQLEELVNSEYTTTEWVTNYQGSGVNGRLITSKSNGNSVFFPANGYVGGSQLSDVGSYGGYWSASLDSAQSAYKLSFSSSGVDVDDDDRYYGYAVRAVQ